MAVGLRRLFRLNINLTNSLLSKTKFINAGVRFMYTEQDLGIMKYENSRFVFRNQFVSIEDTFRTKMKEICNKEDGTIFTEDLKAMLHLVNGSEEDIQLLTDMIYKFHKSMKSTQFGSYVFGPVIMRVFYYLNKPELAMSLFSSPELVDFFMYHSSIRILLCLLFKNNMYQELRDIYKNVVDHKGQEFATGNGILLYAACYKQNTPESADYAINYWKEHCKVKIPSSRSTALVAYLAIKQNRASEALELLSVSDKEYAISIRSLKVLAYMHLRRYLQIIPILKYSTEKDTSIPHRHGYYADVIYELEEKMKTENVSESSDILFLINKLKEQNRIETNLISDEHLMRPIISQDKNKVREDDKVNPKRNMRSEARIGLKNYL